MTGLAHHLNIPNKKIILTDYFKSFLVRLKPG
ncbi:hypothetical protein JL09_g6068 [Pichia kudriavzevii]|uniref:Uncharacterized protein n=1 Tax=Pichia kudriavzevii TaxID=4909 RepID=A0A099NPR0_PICKU|nr:hypothetical protein JL09_g6068 [Pichia kudriavzevii]